MTYPSEPRNPTAMELVRSAVFAPAVLACLQTARLGSYLVDKSVPFTAIDLPLVTVLPQKPKDRAEVNLLDDANGTVIRYIWVASLNRWIQIPSGTAGYTGTIGWSAAASPPPGALAADGSAVSRTTYAGLFAAIGDDYGAGDGSTTFNVPDLVNSFVVGAGDTYALAATGGTATETLSTSQIPSHSHTTELQSVDQAGEPTYGLTVTAPFAGRPIVTYVSTGSKVSTNSAGSGGSHNNLPPYVALNPHIWT